MIDVFSKKKIPTQSLQSLKRIKLGQKNNSLRFLFNLTYVTVVSLCHI